MPPEPTTDPATWLDRHGDAMFRYALLRLHDRDLAADAVQDALLAAVESAASFRGQSQERTWLIGILRHKVLDAIRRRARERPRSDPAAAEDTAADPHPFFKGFWRERQPAWSQLPADPLEREELQRLLMTCITQLPERMREAIVLREIDGLPSDEVCKVLGVTPTNLWTLVHRAKIRLRRDLTEKWFSRDRRPPSSGGRGAGS